MTYLYGEVAGQGVVVDCDGEILTGAERLEQGIVEGVESGRWHVVGLGGGGKA